MREKNWIFFHKNDAEVEANGFSVPKFKTQNDAQGVANGASLDPNSERRASRRRRCPYKT
jgi:hypothetical protein